MRLSKSVSAEVEETPFRIADCDAYSNYNVDVVEDVRGNQVENTSQDKAYDSESSPKHKTHKSGSPREDREASEPED